MAYQMARGAMGRASALWTRISAALVRKELFLKKHTHNFKELKMFFSSTAPYSAPEVLLGKDLDVFCAPETLRLSVHHR